jgi:hypothetical protein
MNSFLNFHKLLTWSFVLFCREIWQQSRAAIYPQRLDIHTRLMKKYQDIPHWWFLSALIGSVTLAITVFHIYKEELQLPWWGILMSMALSSVLTLPIAVLTATTNKVWKSILVKVSFFRSL